MTRNQTGREGPIPGGWAWMCPPFTIHHLPGAHTGAFTRFELPAWGHAREDPQGGAWVWLITPLALAGKLPTSAAEPTPAE